MSNEYFVPSFEDLLKIATNPTEETNNASPGPELNALIQAEVFGAIALTDEEWDFFQAAWLMQSPHLPSNRPVKILRAHPYRPESKFYLDWPGDFSRWASSAQTLVNVMRDDGWLYDLSDYYTTEDRLIRMAGFSKETVRGEATADTDALAICRAALIAVREWKKHELIKAESARTLADTL